MAGGLHLTILTPALLGLTRRANRTRKPLSSNSCRENGGGRIKVGFVPAREKQPLTVGQTFHRRILDRWTRRGILMRRGWSWCFSIFKGNRNTAPGVICKTIGWDSIGVGMLTLLPKQGFFSWRRERYNTHRARRSSLMELV